MNDSGIGMVECVNRGDFVIEVEGEVKGRLADSRKDDAGETSSASSSNSESNKSTESEKTDSGNGGSLTPSNESSDAPPEYSALDGSGDRLLNSTTIDEGEGPKRQSNRVLHGITVAIKKFDCFICRNKSLLIRIAIAMAVIWNLLWLSVAIVKDFQRSIPFLVIIGLVVLFTSYSLFCRKLGSSLKKFCLPCSSLLGRNVNCLKWIGTICALAALVAWIAVDTSKRPHQLISLAGYFVFLFLLFILSKTPEEVTWRPVIWGCGIQMVLGVFVLRTTAGFLLFDYLGNLVQVFLHFVEKGCAFVFGQGFKEHYFAFGVLPIIIYFSAFISILYHLGAMQWLISKIAWLMHISLGTSATESMVAAGNIFVGQTESPLLIRPYIQDLTTSELHAVMVAGFGTVAGSVLGAYLGFGIKAVYVLTACVMAAPCSLAVSKLLYPETKVSKFTSSEGLTLESGGQRNVIEAAFVGASQAIPLVLNIGANLIAFLALLAALNAFLGWYGDLVDIENLSFEFLCSYLFMPFSYLMGIEWADCFKCAELIGTKIFLNEFIAYEKLSVLIDNKNTGNMTRLSLQGDIQWISDRSEAIITYALCGFANVGSLGIMLGGLGGMCPERQSEMAKIVIRALFGGIFVSFLNACIAGFLYAPSPLNCTEILGGSWNSETAQLYQCCSELHPTDLNRTLDMEKCCSYGWPSDFEIIKGC